MRLEIVMTMDDHILAKHVFNAITPENKSYTKVKITSELSGNVLRFTLEGPKLHTTAADLVDSAELAESVLKVLRNAE
ncbi:MAG: hypothetical protein QXL15_00850 [Candidatus Korarchaeota archaeon]